MVSYINNVSNSLMQAYQVGQKYLFEGPQAAYTLATFGGEGASFFTKSLEGLAESGCENFIKLMQNGDCTLHITLTDDGLPAILDKIQPASINVQVCSLPEKFILLFTNGEKSIGGTNIPRKEFLDAIYRFTEETFAKKTFTLLSQGHQLARSALSFLDNPVVNSTVAFAATGCTLYSCKQIYNNLQQPTVAKVAKAAGWGLAAALSTAALYTSGLLMLQKGVT